MFPLMILMVLDVRIKMNSIIQGKLFLFSFKNRKLLKKTDRERKRKYEKLSLVDYA